MFVHAGNEEVIQARKIIAILNVDLFSAHVSNREFLTAQIVQGLAKNETAKSLIITDDSVYLSPFSTGTIRRRMNTTFSGWRIETAKSAGE